MMTRIFALAALGLAGTLAAGCSAIEDALAPDANATAPANGGGAAGGASGPAVVDPAALVLEIQNAREGDVVRAPSGAYDIRDLKIRRSISIVGEGDVVFFSSRTLEKGILNPLPGVSLRVENITFRDAESFDQNGAGIRHDGANLDVVNCRFIENENGILATGQDDGVVRIERSVFHENGYGDGYSHGIYLSSGKNLTITDSEFVGTKVGHHIKSLAEATVVTGSLLDDADGETSYSIDTSRGGAVSIINNTVIQTASAGNYTIFNYDLSRGGDAVSLVIKDNKVVNRRKGGTFLRNDTELTPVIEGNEIINEAGGTLDFTG